MIEFTGVKIALLHKDSIVVYLRDEKAGLPNAGLWDVPGGGRENGESPVQCIKREIREELGLSFDSEQILWMNTFPAMNNPSDTAYFMVATIGSEELTKITFGSEGQEWRLMKISEFMKSDKVVQALKGRLQSYKDATNRSNEA